MLPKEFIQQVLINEYEDIIIKSKHAYIGHALIAIGVEFLGKCVNLELHTWHPNKSNDFDFALKHIPELKKYAKKDLKKLLRNGMAHSLAPMKGLDLSERAHKTQHLGKNKYGYLIINIEDFFEDFKKACQYVINLNFSPEDKMNKDFIIHE